MTTSETQRKDNGATAENPAEPARPLSDTELNQVAGAGGRGGTSGDVKFRGPEYLVRIA